MARKWTTPARVALYQEVIREFGKFNLNDWMFNQKRDLLTGGPCSPNWVDSRTTSEVYADIFKHLVDNHSHKFQELPKSEGALEEQVKWCLSLQTLETSGRSTAKDKFKVKELNRLAAVEAGFMTMDDYRWLVENQL